MRLVPRPRLSWVSTIEGPESGFTGFGVKLGRQRVAGGPFLFKRHRSGPETNQSHLHLKPTRSPNHLSIRTGLTVIDVLEFPKESGHGPDRSLC